MKAIEKLLASKFIHPRQSWLESLIKKGITSEPKVWDEIYMEDYKKIIDISKLKKL